MLSLFQVSLITDMAFSSIRDLLLPLCRKAFFLVLGVEKSRVGLSALNEKIGIRHTSRFSASDTLAHSSNI